MSCNIVLQWGCPNSEEEKTDLEKLFRSVRPTVMGLAGEDDKLDIGTTPIALFSKYERRHRERRREIEIELGYKRTKLENLRKR
jgi:hypothetical protein